MTKLCYCVASNIDYKEALSKLLYSMSYIDPKLVCVFLGRSNFSSTYEKDTIPYFECTEGAYEYLPLIAIANDWVKLQSDFVFLLHDTCLVTREFDELAQDFDPVCDATSVVQHGLNNICCYSIEYLKSKKDWLNTFINCTKNYAVQNERQLFLQAPNKGYYKSHNYFVQDPATNYYGGEARCLEHYMDGTLTKIKANWYTKSVYSESL